MRVLFINMFFWPDSSATSQQLTDLATGLAARADMEVTVLCSAGGYSAAASGQPPAGVHILRAATLPYGRTKIRRLLSYLSFFVTGLYRALTAPRPDVVVSFTTPPVISLLGTCLKIVKGCTRCDGYSRRLAHTFPRVFWLLSNVAAKCTETAQMIL